jgi:hypothetical protein
MTGPEHFQRAEQLAEEADQNLAQDQDQATAAVWATVAQVHATLAVAAAIAAGSASKGRPELPTPGIGPPLPLPGLQALARSGPELGSSLSALM